jgi:hypothetical protein
MQLPTRAAPEPEPVIRIDLMPISLSGNFVAYYSTNGKVSKLEAFETGMGTPVFYKGPRTLLLYAKEEDAKPREEGQPPVIPLAIVALPVSAERVLLLPVPKPDKKVEVRALGVDAKSITAGDYRFYNLSTVNLLGMIGKKQLSLKPGQMQDISDSSVREKEDDLGIQIACVQDDKQKLIYSGMWGHSVQARNFIFMIGTGNPASPIRVRKFHDIPSVRSIGYEPEKRESP